ncbi:M20/M25/M40 family metallo-hydrolase [Candidatus Bathyarchaeota archaeon]|nr:M20/M25/M40 family metallo-hydrolase [Candidatus Bathyarchaeota archaeon]
MISLLTELIRNRCVNPPGGEMKSIDTIRGYLDAHGVESTVYESAPGRGNLVARIQGTSSGPGLMFGPGHVDVAPVEREAEWVVDPFSAVQRDEYIWGRGSHDMLFMVAAHMQAFIDLCVEGFKPSGDLTLLVVCDEEDGKGLGTEWMLDQHPEEVETDYAVTEAGGWLSGPGKVVFTYGEKGGGSSPVESVFVSAMEMAVRMEMPGTTLAPEMMPGKTDLRHLRRLGVECYGFALYDPETPAKALTVHGPNERVSLKTVELTRRAYYNLAKTFLG